MNEIKILPKELQEIIAAGEVVENPAAVVKELVENSLDAFASEIIINIEEGGRGLIEVIDNGIGIGGNFLELSVGRFATSKISKPDDLNSISTFGFRGEALSAISAVSKFKIESRRKEDSFGNKIIIEGGKILFQEETGCPKGTIVSVKELFYNTPARWKFLRGKSSELAKIKEIFTAFAISNPNVRFVLNHDSKRVYSLNHNAEEKRITDMFDTNLGRFEYKEDFIEIHGFILLNNSIRLKNNTMMFVNNRFVFDKIVKRAVTEAMTGYYERDNAPSVIIFIKVHPSNVDVNVHPAKREVKFSNSRNIFESVANAIRNSLVDKHLSVFDQKKTHNNEYLCSDNMASRDLQSVQFNSSLNNMTAFDYYRPNSSFRPLGQISETYIVCEGENGDLVIIDQHAAHERLSFDKLRSEFDNEAVVKQTLLFPEVITLSALNIETIIKNSEFLFKVGFEIEKADGNSIFVRTIPAIIAGDVSNLANLFSNLAEDLYEADSKLAFNEIVNKILATIACHRQVRAGKILSNIEMERLASDVSNEKITHCPHGRPAIVQFKKSELDKWFNRK